MLKVRIKSNRKIDYPELYTLNAFLREYFNNFYSELNSLLSDYHSIQEHTNRSKIIEFIISKKKDFDLLQMFVKGCFLTKRLDFIRAKSEDCYLMGNKIVEMADFLAMIFEDMKTSFIPKPNFVLSLEAFENPRQLLSKELTIKIENINIRPTFKSFDSDVCGNIGDVAAATSINCGQSKLDQSDFDQIHRMMRIYLIKEDISNYELSGASLILKSKYFEFELALCGDIKDPEWRLFEVRSKIQNRQFEEKLLRTFGSSLKQIVDFTDFFENRRHAQEIFLHLDPGASGFYKSFSGKILNIDIVGSFKDDKFKCVIKKDQESIEIKNPTYEYILSLASEITGKKEEDELPFVRPREYKKDVFGENFTYFDQSFFYCFSLVDSCFYFGKISQVCGLRSVKFSMRYEDGKMSAICKKRDLGSDLVNIRLKEQMSDREYIKLCESFMKTNAIFIQIVYLISDFDVDFRVDDGLSTPFFRISKDQKLYTIPENVNICYEEPKLSKNKTKCIESKIRLLYLQKYMMDGCGIIENVLGKKSHLNIGGVKVLITNYVKTDLKFLTEDCRIFNLNQALNYTKNFGILYKFNLNPTFCFEDKVIFNFQYFAQENVTILSYSTNAYKIQGNNILKILKTSEICSKDDSKVFVMLYKVFIADRFISLKHYFRDDNVDSNKIDLGDGKSISLTTEGLKFDSLDSKLNVLMTRLLNTERSIFKFLGKNIDELIKILQSPK